MPFLDWLFDMVRKRDTAQEEVSRQIYDTQVRHLAAQKRLDKLTEDELARLRVIQIRAEVMSRGRGGR